MDERFMRNAMLLGKEAGEKLLRSHVAVFGLGGVGGFAAEALARAGIGSLTLIDCDTVSRSNINRQIHALESTVGLPKTEAAKSRLLDINPNARVSTIFGKYEAASRDLFFCEPYDFIIDAIDLVSCKLDLIETASRLSVPSVSALGTGNKLDAGLLRIADISETSGCPFARVVRKELRRRGILSHTVVYSPEPAMEPESMEAPPPGRRSVPGSLIWVPACAGMLLASHAVLTLSGHKQGGLHSSESVE